VRKKILGGLIVFAVVCSLVLLPAQAPVNVSADAPEEDLSCSSLAVGNLATVDGSVLTGHNEDNGSRANCMHVVPRVMHEPGETITLWTGSVIDQVEGETWSYLWSELANCTFSDTYLNEWGVSIFSDNAGSMKGTSHYDLTQNGIGYWLRRLVPERAKTAREGVLIMGQFVEELGYIQSYRRPDQSERSAGGRNYIVADPNETWIFVVGCGKYWGAQRVPDDEVAFVPNYISIREMDLEDDDNFLACPNLVQHAIDEGWYDPTSGPFDFAKVYNTEDTQTSLGNKLRHWGALRLLTGVEYPDMDDLPFSVVPNRKLSKEDVAEVTRCHYEGTEWAWDPALGYTHPHSYELADGTEIRTICTGSTDESSIMQLRSDMPWFVGNVYWRTECRPCSSVYVPWYSGILSVPEPYTVGEPRVSGEPDPIDRDSAHWTFKELENLVCESYVDRIVKVRATWDNFENADFARQAGIEKAVLSIYHEGKHEDLARQYLTRYTESLALKAFKKAGQLCDKLEK